MKYLALLTSYREIKCTDNYKPL